VIDTNPSSKHWMEIVCHQLIIPEDLFQRSIPTVPAPSLRPEP
jgi:hypothetical protein